MKCFVQKKSSITICVGVKKINFLKFRALYTLYLHILGLHLLTIIYHRLMHYFFSEFVSITMCLVKAKRTGASFTSLCLPQNPAQ